MAQRRALGATAKSNNPTALLGRVKKNANNMAWTTTQLVEELRRLSTPGVVGTYRSFEVTEVLGFRRGTDPINFLSIFVAEPGEPGALDPQPLNPQRLVLRGTDLKFGVYRYRISVQALLNCLTHFDATREWKPGTLPVKVGTLAAVPPQFVPPDSFESHPWNRLLKNNFWEGSHVLELFDTTKPDVLFLLRESRLLTSLAELIRPHLPLGIDGMSDRLGNVLIQLPVTVVSTQVRGSAEGDQLMKAAWHPKATPRPLRISCEMFKDSTVEGFSSQQVDSQVARFRLHSPGGGARAVVWDDANQVILGATEETAFVTSVNISMHVDGFGATGVERNFQVPGLNGLMPEKVVLTTPRTPTNVIGSTPERPREPWRSERVFRQSLQALQERKEFVQYGRITGKGMKDAFADLHALMRMHGTQGVWLWDPYLSATDVLNTLFYCPHADADLRALSAGRQPPDDEGDDADPQAAAATTAAAGATNAAAGAPASPSAGAAPLPISSAMTAARTATSEPEATSAPATWPATCSGAPTATASPQPPWKVRQAALLDAAKGDCTRLKLEFRVRQGGEGWSFHDRFIIFPSERGGAAAWSLGTSVNHLGKQHHILQKVSNGELIHNAFLDLWDSLSGREYLVWQHQ